MEEHKHVSHAEEKSKSHAHAAHKDMLQMKKTDMLLAIIVILAVVLVVSISTCGFRGCKEDVKNQDSQQQVAQNATQQPLQQMGMEGTFTKTGDDICRENGKPLVMLFSTTWCPHCKWIASTFDSMAKSYGDKIAVYHWELDTGDNTLTSAVESEVPSNLRSYYARYNPRGSIPTFVLGCRYFRIGNGYERQSNLTAEDMEFRGIIEKLIAG
jgi:thiol-disulfide isomerase/thioredoxin